MARAADNATEALAVGERLVALSPTTVEYRVELVKAAVLAGDWPRAEAETRHVLDIYPLSAQARLFRTAALSKLGRGGEAAREMNAALSLFADPRARAAAEQWLAGQLR